MPVEVHAGATFSDEASDVGALLELLKPPEWHADAACKEHGEVDLFGRTTTSIDRAKAVCRTCLVRGECRDWSLRQDFDLEGVWGGLSAPERRRGRGKFWSHGTWYNSVRCDTPYGVQSPKVSSGVDDLGGAMTPAERAVDVQLADDDDLAAAVASALSRAGATMDELRNQAATSNFSSERARLAWFMISPLAGS